MMRPLHPLDFLFLSLEKRQQPMHVGGLFLFQIPPHAKDTFIQDLVTDIRINKMIPVPPFNNKLSGLFWDNDPDFDLEHHFRHIALPHPGRIRELLTYVSQEHSSLLDRAKPLWTCHLIEGIEGGRFGMYFKIHHSMIDGVAGMRLLEKSFSRDPQHQGITAPWCIANRRTERLTHPEAPMSQFKKFTRIVQGQIKATPTVFNELAKALKDKKNQHPDYVSSFQAPSTIFNQRVSASRRFAAQSFELARLRRIAQHFNVTINDVVLAICAGALREYLIKQQALPKKPMIAMVPTSIRQDDSDVSNRISMILANLATHLDDRMERLMTIRRSVLNAKQRFERMTTDQILSYSAFVYSPAGFNILSGLMPKRQAFNLVISNLPGPKESLYWNGARLDAIYPASIVLDGQALNITMTSYAGKLEVGLTACRNAVPKMQTLLVHLEDEIVGFEQLIVETDIKTLTTDAKI